MGAVSKVHRLVSATSVWTLCRHGDDALESPTGQKAKGPFVWPDQPNRRIRDPYVRWCGRALPARGGPIPIQDVSRIHVSFVLIANGEPIYGRFGEES